MTLYLAQNIYTSHTEKSLEFEDEDFILFLSKSMRFGFVIAAKWSENVVILFLFVYHFQPLH